MIAAVNIFSQPFQFLQFAAGTDLVGPFLVILCAFDHGGDLIQQCFQVIRIVLYCGGFRFDRQIVNVIQQFFAERFQIFFCKFFQKINFFLFRIIAATFHKAADFAPALIRIRRKIFFQQFKRARCVFCHDHPWRFFLFDGRSFFRCYCSFIFRCRVCFRRTFLFRFCFRLLLLLRLRLCVVDRRLFPDDFDFLFIGTHRPACPGLFDVPDRTGKEQDHKNQPANDRQTQFCSGIPKTFLRFFHIFQFRFRLSFSAEPFHCNGVEFIENITPAVGSFFRIFLHQTVDQDRQPGGKFRFYGDQRFRLFIQLFLTKLRRIVSFKRRMPGKDLIQCRTEGIHIGFESDLIHFSAYDFRRSVSGRCHQFIFAFRRVVMVIFCKPEVCQFEFLPFRENDIFRFDIPVCQFLGFPCKGQRICDPGGAFERKIIIQCSELTGMQFQIVPGDQFHYKIMKTVFGSSCIDCLNDIRVIQCRRRTGFTEKCFHKNGIACHFIGKDFQRHITIQIQLFRQIYHAHAAAPDFPFHTETVDNSAGSNIAVCRKICTAIGASPGNTVRGIFHRYSFYCSVTGLTKKTKHPDLFSGFILSMEDHAGYFFVTR